MSDNKPTLTTDEWQKASTALALMRDGRNDMHGLRQRLNIGAGHLSELLSKLNQLDLVIWLNGKPFLTQKGARSCRLITLVEGNVRLRPLA